MALRFKVYLAGDRQAGGAMRLWSRHRTTEVAHKVAISVARKYKGKEVMVYCGQDHVTTYLIAEGSNL